MTGSSSSSGLGQTVVNDSVSHPQLPQPAYSIAFSLGTDGTVSSMDEGFMNAVNQAGIRTTPTFPVRVINDLTTNTSSSTTDTSVASDDLEMDHAEEIPSVPVATERLTESPILSNSLQRPTESKANSTSVDKKEEEPIEKRLFTFQSLTFCLPTSFDPFAVKSRLPMIRFSVGGGSEDINSFSERQSQEAPKEDGGVSYIPHLNLFLDSNFSLSDSSDDEEEDGFQSLPGDRPPSSIKTPDQKRRSIRIGPGTEGSLDLRWPHRNLLILTGGKTPSFPSVTRSSSQSPFVVRSSDGDLNNGDDDTVKDESESGRASDTDDDLTESLADDDEAPNVEWGTISSEYTGRGRSSLSRHDRSTGDDMDYLEKELFGELDDNDDEPRQGRAPVRQQHRKRSSALQQQPQASNQQRPGVFDSLPRSSLLYRIPTAIPGSVVVSDSYISSRMSVMSNLSRSNSMESMAPSRRLSRKMSDDVAENWVKSYSIRRDEFRRRSKGAEAPMDVHLVETSGKEKLKSEKGSERSVNVLGIFDHYDRKDPNIAAAKRLAKEAQDNIFVKVPTHESDSLDSIRSILYLYPSLLNLPETHFLPIDRDFLPPPPPGQIDAKLFSEDQILLQLAAGVHGPIHDLLRAYRSRKTSPTTSIRYLFSAAFYYPTFSLPLSPSPFSSLARRPWPKVQAGSLPRDNIIRGVDPRAIAMYLLGLCLLKGIGSVSDVKNGVILMEQAAAVAAEAVGVAGERMLTSTILDPTTVSNVFGGRPPVIVESDARKRSRSADPSWRTQSVTSVQISTPPPATPSFDITKLTKRLSNSILGNQQPSAWLTPEEVEKKAQENSWMKRKSSIQSDVASLASARRSPSPTPKPIFMSRSKSLGPKWKPMTPTSSMLFGKPSTPSTVLSSTHGIYNDLDSVQRIVPDGYSVLTASMAASEDSFGSTPMFTTYGNRVRQSQIISEPNRTPKPASTPAPSRRPSTNSHLLDQGHNENPKLETLANSPIWATVLKMAEGLDDSVNLEDGTPKKTCISLRATRHFLKFPTRCLGQSYAERSKFIAKGSPIRGKSTSMERSKSPYRWKKNMPIAIYYFEIAAALGDSYSHSWLEAQGELPFQKIRNPLFPLPANLGLEEVVPRSNRVKGRV
ncbi:hypothetical protein HDU97_003792 [Phlyctochytrium planicorne]|nr:hypothetical protein HDU97_003792 [Phlyctochytrium planicorne]